MLFPAFANTVPKGLYEAWLVAELVDESHLRDPSGALKTCCDRVEYGGCGGAGVLWVHGQNHQSSNIGGLQFPDSAVDGWLTITHAQRYHDLVAKALLQHFAQDEFAKQCRAESHSRANEAIR